MKNMFLKLNDQTESLKDFVNWYKESYENYKEVLLRLKSITRLIDDIETVIINKEMYQNELINEEKQETEYPPMN